MILTLLNAVLGTVINGSFFDLIFYELQMQRETEERGFTASSCEQEVDGDEQAVDGGE